MKTKEKNTSASPRRELDPHIRFCADQFGFDIEWREYTINGKVFEANWYITHDGDQFYWTDDQRIESFFDKVSDYFRQDTRKLRKSIVAELKAKLHDAINDL